jgi:plasmid stabilization system protein ParE
VKHRVVLTARALQQLSDSSRWWAENRSAEQALRWLTGFEAAIAGIADRPERFPLARENHFADLPYPLRQLVYGLGKRPTHRAVYEVRDQTVYIVAIRHLAQDDLSPEDLE